VVRCGDFPHHLSDDRNDPQYAAATAGIFIVVMKKF